MALYRMGGWMCGSLMTGRVLSIGNVRGRYVNTHQWKRRQNIYSRNQEQFPRSRYCSVTNEEASASEFATTDEVDRILESLSAEDIQDGTMSSIEGKHLRILENQAEASNLGKFFAPRRHAKLIDLYHNKPKWNWEELRAKDDSDKNKKVEPQSRTPLPMEHTTFEHQTMAETSLESLNDFAMGVRKVDAPPYAPPSPLERKRVLDQHGCAQAVGRRKTATATAILKPDGSGEITVNGKPLVMYFSNIRLRDQVLQPLFVTERLNFFNVHIQVRGGGESGQAGAIQLAIARALQNFDPNFRPVLKYGGYLERDARRVERKKHGLRKARKAEQWGKR